MPIGMVLTVAFMLGISIKVWSSMTTDFAEHLDHEVGRRFGG